MEKNRKKTFISNARIGGKKYRKKTPPKGGSFFLPCIFSTPICTREKKKKKMTCRKCNQKMHCIDSRPHNRGTYRRHECRGCHNRTSTVEVTREWHDQAQAALDKLREIRLMVAHNQ